jgi:hypothetical protein
MNHRKLIQLCAMLLPLGHEAIHVLYKLFVVISLQEMLVYDDLLQTNQRLLG